MDTVLPKTCKFGQPLASVITLQSSPLSAKFTSICKMHYPVRVMNVVLQKKKIYSIFFVMLALSYSIHIKSVRAQSVADTLSDETVSTEAGELVIEKILKVSDSKKIFILTNSNGALGKGDFFSILLDEQLAARALVAKNKDNVVGIKVLKIYSLKVFNLLREGISVQILRGDDSYYFNRRKKPEKKLEVEKIKDEEDLYLMEDSADIDENKNRIIKPDNIIGAAYSQISVSDIADGSTSFTFMNFHWAYQMTNNVWFQFQYAYANMPDYPNAGIDTTVNAYTFRVKYTIQAPFYSYIMPYLGYRVQQADSPDAGVAGTQTVDQTILDRESELVDDLKTQQVIVGATLLRRLVPGWFATVDIGTDGWNVGLALEF